MTLTFLLLKYINEVLEAFISVLTVSLIAMSYSKFASFNLLVAIQMSLFIGLLTTILETWNPLLNEKIKRKITG